ncbi:peroxiredoxin [Rhodothalassium salexigens DSM 2132]|uniref:Peroxiredoxin n=1 Tax=Rhodothalassium salexigens DSM 2132 TaxID=1188247 RepID=A0A4R2PFD7_RHOSA|nr:thioredoxin family protein [Rhodothalassium salexigens]MBB4211837.1 peroxiredoxin [Rhodothalassium salexigens DSM 2132]MBK1638866.1 thioredoxin family protein [Rhodothalassium salexigens DSM 2132]TCP33867.1 peroxiredoxin [Rhodothalassium salexigens DSM 2132]
MVSLQTPPGDLGWTAAEFSLPDLDGTPRRFADVAGEAGTVIAFICNHCPYVKAMIPRFIADAAALKAAGVGVAAIMPNDFHAYPDDAPDAMRAFAAGTGLDCPYLLDESQAVARAYGAVCTPDFFGFDAAGRLVYRGRLDAGRKDPPPADAPHELRDAMLAVAAGRGAPETQLPSMGCSIKWRQG